MKKKITCFCEHSFETEVQEEYHFSPEDRLSQIKEGALMNVDCPLCGKKLKPEFPCRLTGSKWNIHWYFIPEVDRMAYKAGKLDYDPGSPDRIIIGYRELVEKTVIREVELDDQVIEIIKFYLLGKIEEENPEGDVRLWFHDKKEDKLSFYIEGLREEELGIYEMKADFYEKVKKEKEKKLKDKNFASLITPPYVSINNLFME